MDSLWNKSQKSGKHKEKISLKISLLVRNRKLDKERMLQFEGSEDTRNHLENTSWVDSKFAHTQNLFVQTWILADSNWVIFFIFFGYDIESRWCGSHAQWQFRRRQTLGDLFKFMSFISSFTCLLFPWFFVQ